MATLVDDVIEFIKQKGAGSIYVDNSQGKHTRIYFTYRGVTRFTIASRSAKADSDWRAFENTKRGINQLFTDIEVLTPDFIDEIEDSRPRGTFELPQTFGERLQWAREQQQLSRQKLANLSGVGESLINVYEVSKQHEPENKDIVQKLAAALNLSATYFTGEEEPVEEKESNNMSDTAVADGLAMGKRVQERRGEMNLTLGMLSEKTGITTQQLANLETGLYPDFFKLPDIAKALNTTVDYLKTGKGVGASYTDINTSIELGAFVRYLRMKQGLTQTQLGERIGQDYGSEISKMERGLSTLPIRNKADRLGPALAFSAENLRNIADRVLLAERDPVLPRAAPSPRQAQAIPDSTVPGDVIAAIREEGRLTRELLTKQHEQLLQIIRAMPGSDLAAALHTLIDNLLKKR